MAIDRSMRSVRWGGRELPGDTTPSEPVSGPEGYDERRGLRASSTLAVRCGAGCGLCWSSVGRPSRLQLGSGANIQDSVLCKPLTRPSTRQSMRRRAGICARNWWHCCVKAEVHASLAPVALIAEAHCRTSSASTCARLRPTIDCCRDTGGARQGTCRLRHAAIG